jgi:hypothetical protein
MSFLAMETDDVIVASHALRLGVLDGLTSHASRADGGFGYVIVKDGELLLMFLSFSGREDGDNGLAMVVTKDLPGASEFLNRLALGNCLERPLRKEIRKPWMN